MSLTKKSLCALLLCSLICLAMLNGCSSGAGSESGGENSESPANLGSFTIEDITGKTYTEEMFADWDLTMVNVFTTWCGPCVREIPELESLKNNMSSKGVNVVGIVLDAASDTGSKNEETIETAKLLAQQTGATYPFLIPDAGWLNGRLLGIDAVPETFFVDSKGNIVGETYSGSRSLEDWTSIVEKEQKGAAK